ncbi:MAG: ABC transporter permease [Spirochaetales bacterium]|jgi:general nucleoside transport system permease protein|nr:ABC transporter permease [Spirochaetales bacterium]
MSESGYAVPLVHNAVGIMTPFLLAATGGLFTELTGMLNIALEGLMLIGAFFSVVFAAATGSLFLGIVLGIASSMLAAYLFGVMSLHLKANIFISGLATNLLASGLTVVLAFRLFGNKGVIRFEGISKLPVLTIPWLQKVPIIGDILVGHNVLVYLSWLVLLVAAILIYRTSFGLRIRGTGQDSATIESLGLKPIGYQMKAILISGFTCGLAGSILTLNLSAFVPNITSGRGWIALVVIYLGNKTPLGILIASFVFGFAEAFSNYAQGAINIPADFILAFPYIITVAAMIVYSIWRHHKLKKVK